MKSWNQHRGPVLDRCGSFDVLDCVLCGFAHVVPIPDPEQMDVVYREEYYSKEKPLFLERHRRDLDWWNLCYDQRYDTFESVLPVGRRRILDIGSGPGFFLKRGKDRGWSVLGVEPSKQAAAHSRGLGLEIVEEFLTPSLAETLGAFNVVHLSEVLEHIPDPAAMLSTAFRLLSPGGLVCVLTPNDYSPFQRALRTTCGFKPWWVSPPHHINYFTVDSLSRLISRSGFEILLREATFPIDMFLLMGDNYVGHDAVGRQCHERRMIFEKNLRASGLTDLHRTLYRQLSDLGIGREIIVYGKKAERTGHLAVRAEDRERHPRGGRTSTSVRAERAPASVLSREVTKIEWRAVDSFRGNSTSSTLVERRACPVCGSWRSRAVFQMPEFQCYSDSRSLPKRLDLVTHQCADCQALFMNPGYSRRGFRTLFAEAGCSYGSSSEHTAEQIEWMERAGLLRAGHVVLDVGCYDGTFLSRMPSTVERIGVDVGASAIRRGREKHAGQGLTLVASSFETFRMKKKPDVICLFHVLEHLPKPVDVLRRLRARSRRNTVLVVEVPVLERAEVGDINGFLAMQHMTHFSRASLRHTLARAGWDVKEELELKGYNGLRARCIPGKIHRVIRGCPSDVKRFHDYFAAWSLGVAAVCGKMQKLDRAQRVVVWGGGIHTECLYQLTGRFGSKAFRSCVMVDSDPLKQGRSWRGVKIVPPSALRGIRWAGTALLVSSYGSQEEICAAARELGCPARCLVKLYDRVRAY